jgi:DNA repair exonuclease SbcCD ATPase subunit
MADYLIKLGVDVDVSDIQAQINDKAKDTSIPVKLDISNLGDIKKQIQSLGGIKGGIDIPLTIDTNSVVKSAQQVGQKIGSSVTKQVQKTLNIDDIIDSEVLDLMKTFSIAGDKGSNAFKEIRQALVECRSELQKLKNSDIGIDAEAFDTSRAFDKVSDAIANQMRAVNSLGDEYIKLAKYMKNFNDPKKGNKVRVPDFIKQEQGDDYKSSRGTLGIAFNTEKGISFASFIEDLNHELGIAIDLTKGEEKAYEELVHKLRLGREQLEAQKKSKTSLQASASTDEILAQNYINKNEIRDVAESSIDYINATEAAERTFAQTSTETANVVVQNEERKQQAIQETSKVFSSIQKGNFQKSFAPADDDLGGMKNTAKSVEQYFKNLQGVIADTVSVQERFDTNGNLDGFTVSLKNANGEAEKLRYTFEAATKDSKAFFKYAGGSIDDKTVGKQTEKSVKKANDLQIKLDKVQSGYLNSTKPIKDEAHVKSLDDQYNKVKTAIDAVRNADDATYQSMVSNVETEIAKLESLVAKYRNIETVATSLRSKDFDTVKATYADKLDEKISKIQGAGVYKFDYGDVDGETVTFEKRAEQLKAMLSNVAKYDRSGLVSFLNELDKLESGYKKAKAAKDEFNRYQNVASSVSTLKSEIEILQQASPSLKNFKASIKDVDGSIKEVSLKSLLEQLDQVGTVGDFKVVEGNLKAFKTAAESAGIDLKETNTEAKNVNDAYQKIYNTRKKIGELEVKLIGAKVKDDIKTIEDTNSEIARLKNNLATLETDDIGSKFTEKQKANLKELRKQIQYNKKQAQNSVDYKADTQATKAEAKEVNDAYNEIYNLKKKIGSLEVDLISAEDTKDAQNLRSEIERLKVSLAALDKDGISSKFTEKQKNSLKELENQIDFNKRQAENKVETKLELQIDKEETKKAEESFKELKRLATEMGKIDIELAGLTDVDKDLDKFNSLKRMAEELEVEFNVLLEKANLNPDQLKELHQIFSNTTGAVRELNSEMAKSAEAKELTSGLERLKSIAKEINALKLDIFKFEDADNIEQATNRLNELENEATELRAELQQKFNIASFDEIDDIARQGKEALDNLVAKAAEARAKLAQGIKLDIELGNFENEIDTMRSKFNSLSDANTDLRRSVELVENAYQEMLNASKANTGDEVADRERLIEAEKKYAAALEKTNNLIKIQARADKKDADKQRLEDNREVFQAKIDAWMAKNSAATKQFGASLLDLRAKAEKADQVELNHLEKELAKIDKAADKAGLKMLSFGDQIKSKFKQYMAYFSVAEVFMWVEQGLREMFNTVKEIDTAMTGLYRVTDLTASQYDTLFNNMIDSAKEYGATLNDIINATTDWVRAGFEADTALGLAEVTTMYQHISDLDYDTAAENLITAYNGFKDELNGAFDGDQVAAVEYIADIFNELDNNFAVTSAGLGEALTRSASALDLAGNTIQETAG